MSKKKLDKMTLMEAQYQICNDLLKTIQDQTEPSSGYWGSGMKSCADSIEKTFKCLLRRSE